jgi:hypothetical protein
MLVSKIFIRSHSATFIIEFGMSTVHVTIFRPTKLTQIAHSLKYR